ncbi:hypothetical protein FB567DRAFT_538348 [Paraphoma chrysanthemicola]|uniref:Fungal N-terminal domain-containing protein n=1 Tax=Paraphoma chrysanthemicola TaxID=798071 RepID=A0A8K0QVG1_9PLEO|nr:hypothetical protein FB567DRAFT_538348 [Paraphoma chrysanthemicola]
MALETAAAIIGILAAAGTVAQILAPAITSFGDATKNAAAVLTEVNHMRIILSALQGYLEDLSTSSPHRKELIQLDQLVATLTDGVLLFDELETLVKRLSKSKDGNVSRLGWARNDSKFASIKSRMQCFKSSITIMLNILQCESDQEARRNHAQLLAVCTVLLRSNTELTRRLTHLETCFDSAESMLTRRPDSIMSSETITKYGNNTAMERLAEELHSMSLFSLSDSQFETVLEASTVYRRARKPGCDSSFRSSIVRSHAWTVLSDISLSEISVISVIALPIRLLDIANAQHYTFGGNILQTLEEEPLEDLVLLQSKQKLTSGYTDTDPMYAAPYIVHKTPWIEKMATSKLKSIGPRAKRLYLVIEAAPYADLRSLIEVRGSLHYLPKDIGVDDVDGVDVLVQVERARSNAQDSSALLRQQPQHTANVDMRLLVYSANSPPPSDYVRTITDRYKSFRVPIAFVALHKGVGRQFTPVCEHLAHEMGFDHHEIVENAPLDLDKIIKGLVRRNLGKFSINA